MKNVVKNSFFIVFWVLVTNLNNVSLALDVKSGTPWGTKWDGGTGWDFVATLNNILWFIIGLLYFIAVVFALYWGFLILTASWDEERVKKGKTTLINAVIGLIVIFLASQIINWVINVFTDRTIIGA